MAYVKTVWETGDVITAAKLNNAEDGIEAAQMLVVDIEAGESGTYILSATYAEIKAAAFAGGVIFRLVSSGLTDNTMIFYLDTMDEAEGSYSVTVVSFSDILSSTTPLNAFVAASDDGELVSTGN